jgi:hypothetical protein
MCQRMNGIHRNLQEIWDEKFSCRVNVEDGKIFMVHMHADTTFHPISLVAFYVCHSFFDTLK